MTKTTDIDEILAGKPTDLLIEELWNDTAIIARIRARLNNVSEENIEYYHAHFCGSRAEEKT